MNERIVAGRTEPPDMREKGKHGARSAGFTERRVIVHRSADRGAVPGPRRLLYCARSFCAAVPLLKGAAFGFTGVLQKYRKVSQLLGSLFSLIHYLTLGGKKTSSIAPVVCPGIMLLVLLLLCQDKKKS